MKNKINLKNKKLLALVGFIAVIAITVIILVSVLGNDYKVDRGYKYDGSSLVGSWIVDDDFSHDGYYIYEFFPINSAGYGKVSTTYLVRGIPFLFEDSSTYRIEGTNTLIMTYSVDGVLKNSSSKFSMNQERNKIVINGEEKLLLKKNDLQYNSDKSILGKWVDTANPTDEYTFLEDYTGTMKGASSETKILFSTLDSKMYLYINENLPTNDYGNVEVVSEYVTEIPYSINGDVLTLQIEGVNYTFERKK